MALGSIHNGAYCICLVTLLGPKFIDQQFLILWIASGWLGAIRTSRRLTTSENWFWKCVFLANLMLRPRSMLSWSRNFAQHTYTIPFGSVCRLKRMTLIFYWTNFFCFSVFFLQLSTKSRRSAITCIRDTREYGRICVFATTTTLHTATTTGDVPANVPPDA